MTTSGATSGSPLATPVDWHDLTDTGRALLVPVPPATQPTPGAIRRAVSTAYYAMFHALVGSNADTLVGLPHDNVALDAWLRIYRNTQHRVAYNALKNNRAKFSPRSRRFADLFRDFQDERHTADYNPLASVSAQMAFNWLNQAEAAIEDFLQVGSAERVFVATLTLVPGNR